MPISRNGKAYYTKEQYEEAKYNSNALEYAKSRGYDLKNENGWYKLREHDSMVFTPDGRWYWNSRGLSGGAMEFMMYYEGMTITEAVLTLAGEREQSTARPQQRPPVRKETEEAKVVEQRQFVLPRKAPDFKRLFSYLCGERGLEKSVVQELIRQNLVYQSYSTIPGGRVLNNAVFVYRDNQGKAVGAFVRGMSDREGYPPYKRDAAGSDKQWGWLFRSPANPATTVRVFEGAIDAASDASLAARNGGDNWKTVPVDRLSLEGLGMKPLQNYLQSHPGVRQVALMLDADEAGSKATGQISEWLTNQGYEVEVDVPPFGKDWNEVLLGIRAMEAEQQEAAPQQESPEI